MMWTATNTHIGEEKELLKAHKQILKKIPNTLLIIIPRHIERCNEIIKITKKTSLDYKLISNEKKRKSNSFKKQFQVLIVNIIGETSIFYKTCDLAFIGGSLKNKGGHNMLEAACLKKSIILGHSTFNFEYISQKLYIRVHCLDKSSNINLALWYSYEALSGWGSGKVFLDIFLKIQKN